MLAMRPGGWIGSGHSHRIEKKTFLMTNAEISQFDAQHVQSDLHAYALSINKHTYTLRDSTFMFANAFRFHYTPPLARTLTMQPPYPLTTTHYAMAVLPSASTLR